MPEGLAPHGREMIMRTGATYKDVLAAPEHKIAELIDGTLYLQPRPASPHAQAMSSLGIEIGGPFGRNRGGPGGWWILFEPELHFGANVVVPDIAGWRRARMPKIPNVAAFTLAPDWVCEVLSPGTRRLDVSLKRDLYLREGVAFLWFVDPRARTLEALANRDGAWKPAGTLEGAAEVRLPPFDAVGWPLDALWID